MSKVDIKQKNLRLKKLKVNRLRKKLAEIKEPPKQTRKHKKRTWPEQETQNILEELDIEFEIEKPFRFKDTWKHFDIAINELNLLIEVDGDYWHMSEVKDYSKNFVQIKNMKNDAVKNWLANTQGWKLIRIKESELKEDRQRVKDMLKNTITELKESLSQGTITEKKDENGEK